jgi:hypothetical protein
MSNGGIIGPVVNPQRGSVTTVITASGTLLKPGFGPGELQLLVVAGGGGGESTFNCRSKLGAGGAGGLILTP